MGGTIWFRDKNTGLEYELNSSSEPSITTLDSVYYVSTAHRVLEIKDPALLKPCEKEYYYDSIKNVRYTHGSESLIGADIVYTDSIGPWSWEVPDSYIATSFVRNDSLCHVFADLVKGAVYLSFLDGGAMNPMEILGEGMYLYDRHYSYRRRSPSDNSRFLKVHTDNENLFGFIDMHQKYIDITYFNNLYSEQRFGAMLSDSLFKELFNYGVSNLGCLYLCQIDSLEQHLGGTDFTQLHKMHISYYYPNKNNYELETPRIYQKIEDSDIKVHSKYYFEANSGSVKVLEFNWLETDPQYYPPLSEEENSRKARLFQSKCKMINDFLSRKLGQPVKNNEWRSPDGVTIKLGGENFEKYRRITLVGYKD